jgi:hypothetical protein
MAAYGLGWVDDGGGGTGFAFRPFAAFDVERVMNAIEHAVALPPHEVIVHRAARRKILRQIAPLTTSAQDVHQAVHYRAHVGAALATAGRGGGISGATTAHSSSVRSLGYLR